MASKKPRKRGPGNPPDSPWYSAANEARGRPRALFTLDPVTIELLKKLATAEGRSRSQIVDAAVAAYAKASKSK